MSLAKSHRNRPEPWQVYLAIGDAGSSLSSRDRHTLNAIVRECWWKPSGFLGAISQEIIAHRTGLSVKSVQRSLRDLLAEKWIHTVLQRGGKNQYIINVGKVLLAQKAGLVELFKRLEEANSQKIPEGRTLDIPFNPLNFGVEVLGPPDRSAGDRDHSDEDDQGNLDDLDEDIPAGIQVPGSFLPHASRNPKGAA